MTNNNSSRGFTLVEMLISSMVLTLVGAGVFTLLNQGQNSFRSQKDMTAVVQQARIAMDLIATSLRSAGNDPQDIFSGETPPFSHSHSGLFPIEISGSGHIQINTDLTGSVTGGATLDRRGDPDGTLNQRNEKVVIRYDSSGNNLYMNIGDGEELLAKNISSFDFIYYDMAGALISSPASNENAIVQVHVELVADTADPDPTSGKIQTITLEAAVMLRSKSFSVFE